MGSGRKAGGNPVKYYATLEQVVCMSPADAIVEIEINDEKAWVEPITDNREFYIEPEMKVSVGAQYHNGEIEKTDQESGN